MIRPKMESRSRVIQPRFAESKSRVIERSPTERMSKSVVVERPRTAIYQDEPAPTLRPEEVVVVEAVLEPEAEESAS